MWSGFVDLIRVTIFAAAHVCGGSLGAGIVCVSLVLRLALLPLTLRLARQARLQQTRLAALKPQIDALQRRHAADPVRAMRETRALYAANGIRVLSIHGIAGLLVHVPLLSGLFAAVRGGLGARVPFLWVSNLAQPNALLLAVVALAGGAVMAMPRPHGAAAAPSVPLLVATGLGGTLVFLWSASSAVALSVGAGSLVSGLQSWLLARDGAQPAHRA